MAPRAVIGNKSMWFENIVFYQVLVRSFKDSDGDGYGDFRGLVSKLDYIRDLGVGAIYLNPVTVAAFDPETDELDKDQYAGYESVDLMTTDPTYGSLSDFRELIDQARRRGLRVVVDFLTLGLSSRHPHFQDVLRNGSASSYADLFCISEEIPPGEWLCHGGRPWNRMPDGRYYYALWKDYPFLNLRNKRTRDFFYQVADFWLCQGVDGLRVDAAKYLFASGPGVAGQEHQPETLEFWRQFKRHICGKYGNEKILIGEVLPIPVDVDYLGNNRQIFDFLYDGVFAEAVFSAPQIIVEQLTANYCAGWFEEQDNPSGIIYNSNHDRGRLVLRLLDANDPKLKLLASLLLLSNGTPMIYFGEELGLSGRVIPEQPSIRDFISTMAWDELPMGGFTSASTTRAPVSYDVGNRNVKSQDADSQSILHHYRDLIHLRRRLPEFYLGERHTPRQQNPKVYCYLLSTLTSSVLVVHNLSASVQSTSIELPLPVAGAELTTEHGSAGVRCGTGKGEIELDALLPFQSVVLRLPRLGSDRLIASRFDPVALGRLDRLPATLLSGHHYRCDEVRGGALFLSRPSPQTEVRFYSRLKGKTLLSATIPVRSQADAVVPVSADADYLTFSPSQDVVAAPLDWTGFLAARTREVASHRSNRTLRSFWCGADDDFWYFVFEKSPVLALERGGGLDFALVLCDEGPRPADPCSLSFWLLPRILVHGRVSALLLYQEGSRLNKPVLFNRPSPTCMPGEKNARSVIFHQSTTQWITLVSREFLPSESYQVAALCWSACGRWIHRDSSHNPIVELLPNDDEAKSNGTVRRFVTIDTGA